MRRRVVFLLLFLFLAVTGLCAADDLLATLRSGHPRLLVTGPDVWTRLRELRKTDPRFAEVVRLIEADAWRLLASPVAEYHKTGRRLLAVSRTVLQRTLVLSFMYQLSGDKAYALRTERELLAAAAFPDWNPSHFLDVAEMTAALSIGYDWLNDVLTPEALVKIRAAIVEKGLREALDIHASHNNWQSTENNWNQVCFGGLTLGALAVADDEPAIARQILRQARTGIVHGLKPYAPDGVYPEGPGYWSYGTTYQVIMVAALESALGTDWAITKSPGFAATASAYVQQVGPSGLHFNFSDGSEAGELQPALFWFARHLKNPALACTQARYVATKSDGAASRRSGRLLPLAAIWWPEPGAFDAKLSLPLCWHGRGENPIGVFRSSWTDPRALYLAFKGGSAGLNHAHMDAGSFVFEADGVRWASDLGAQDYESLESKKIDLWDKKQDSQRWQVFRLNNHSHNTLTIDGQLHRVAGSAELVKFNDEHAAAYVVLDLTTVFAGQATSVRRGFRLLNGGATVLIQDEIVGAKPGAVVRWAMVTGSVVTIDGNRATLRENGQMLEAQLLAPEGAKFTVIPADPPADSFNVPNPGRRILVVTASADGQGSLGIGVWLKPGSVTGASVPRIKPLAEWLTKE